MNVKTLSLFAALLLAGCSGTSLLTSTEPRQTIYTLQPEDVAARPDTKAVTRIVEISKPSVPPGFERDRIALYLDNGRTLDYFASARWSAPLEDIVQDFTRRTLPNAVPNIVTTTPGQSVESEYRLQIKLNEFQPVYERDQAASPLLKTEIEFTLIRLPQETIVSHFTLKKSGRANANNLETITAGLEMMLRDIESHAFEKIGATINKDSSKR